MLGIAVVATTLLLAPPAHAARGERSGVLAAGEEADPAVAAGGREAALVGAERPLSNLPFARLDLAILVLGGAVVIAAAAGAPRLFGPMRLAPAVARGTASDPLPLPNQGAVAHAPADHVPSEPSRHRGARQLLLLLLAGIFLLVASPAALGQADYTGVAPPPTYVDTYIGTYVGPTPVGGAGQLAAPRAQSAAGGAISVGNPALGSPSAGDQGAGRLVTGWDMVTIAALGLTAVVGFAVSAGRFRSL